MNYFKTIAKMIKNSKELTTQQKHYIMLLEENHVAIMRKVLMDLSENDSIELFSKIVRSKKDLALSILDNINPRLKRFHKLFNSLEESTQQKYIQHAIKHTRIATMMGIFISLSKENSTILFTSLLKEDKKLAFSTIKNVYFNNRERFKDLFAVLKEEIEEYIKYTIKNNYVTGMAGILMSLSEPSATALLKIILKQYITQKLVFSVLNYVYNDSKKKFVVFLSVVHEEKYINYYISHLEKAETRLAQKVLKFLGERNHSSTLRKTHYPSVHDDNHNVQNNQVALVNSSNKSDDETLIKLEENLPIVTDTAEVLNNLSEKTEFLKYLLTCTTSNNLFSVINKETHINYNSNCNNAQSNQVVSPRKKQKRDDDFNIESSNPSGMLMEPKICTVGQSTLFRF